jgi:PhnB protein
MQTSTHLHFNGNCREAFKFYAETLGGHITFALTYGESPAAKQTAPEAQDRIIHTRLEVRGQALLGCDDVRPGGYAPPRGFSVMVETDDPAEAERVFHALAQGGSIAMPLGETFWARRFGVCTDRFGVPWMVNCAKPQ